MWGFQRTLVISGCHVSISPVLNWYRLQQRNPGCIRGEDHVFHVSSFALAMLYKSKIPDYMHWKKNSVLRILPIWQTILASKHQNWTLYLALFLVAVAEHITGVVSDHITHLQHWALCRLWPCTATEHHGATKCLISDLFTRNWSALKCFVKSTKSSSASAALMLLVSKSENNTSARMERYDWRVKPEVLKFITQMHSTKLFFC